MRNRLLTISINIIFAAAVVILQSCDSKVNIEEPQQFYKYIGSDGDQWAVDLVADSEDNIYILGRSDSPADSSVQLYVVKTSSKGIVLWEKTFGEGGDETPKDIELLSDGNLVLVADYADADEKDFVIYTLNAADGSVIGTRKDGTLLADYVNSVTQISNGFIVASYSDNGSFKEASVFRYDVNFNRIPALLWDVQLSQLDGTSGYDFIPFKVIQVRSDLFYTFCYTNSPFGDGVADYNFFIYVSSQENGPINRLILPGPDTNSDERLTSVKVVPPQSGSGFVMAGYISSPTTNQQDLYIVKVVQDLENVLPSRPDSYRQGKVVTSGLSSITSSNASVFPSKGEGFFLLGDQNSLGTDDIFLTKVDNTMNDVWTGSRSFGGAGNDASGAVVETSDGRIVLCGTMVLGDVIGQKKVVLMNLSPNGLFGE